MHMPPDTSGLHESELMERSCDVTSAHNQPLDIAQYETAFEQLHRAGGQRISQQSVVEDYEQKLNHVPAPDLNFQREPFYPRICNASWCRSRNTWVVKLLRKMEQQLEVFFTQLVTDQCKTHSLKATAGGQLELAFALCYKGH